MLTNNISTASLFDIKLGLKPSTSFFPNFNRRMLDLVHATARDLRRDSDYPYLHNLITTWRNRCYSTLAEGVGFEPTRRFPACRFSRPVPSTTRPPLQRPATDAGLVARPGGAAGYITGKAGLSSPFWPALRRKNTSKTRASETNHCCFAGGRLFCQYAAKEVRPC